MKNKFLVSIFLVLTVALSSFAAYQNLDGTTVSRFSIGPFPSPQGRILVLGAGHPTAPETVFFGAEDLSGTTIQYKVDVGTEDRTANNPGLDSSRTRVGTGQATDGGNSGQVHLFTGTVLAGAGNTGSVSIFSGNNLGTGNSGQISLLTGTSAGGNRGRINLDSGRVEMIDSTQALDPSGFAVLTTNRNFDSGAQDTQSIVVESGRVQDAGQSGDTGEAIFRSGDIRSGALGVTKTGDTTLRSGGVQAGGLVGTLTQTGNLFVQSGIIDDAAAGAGVSTGVVNLRSGNNAGAGNSGNVNISTGTVVGGTRGDIVFAGNDANFTGMTSADFSGVILTGVANDTLSNLSSPVAFNQDLLPDADGVRDLGGLSLRPASVFTDDVLTRTMRLNTSGSDVNIAIVGGASLTSPSGVSIDGFRHEPANIVGAREYGFYTSSDAIVDANPTKSLQLETGNKTAGTGDSGSINLITGTSAGGARGDITFSGDNADFTGMTSADFTGVTVNGLTEGANKNLSNLDSPTAINQSLLPSGTINIGANGNEFNQIYGDSLFLGGNTFDGKITLRDASAVTHGEITSDVSASVALEIAVSAGNQGGMDLLVAGNATEGSDINAYTSDFASSTKTGDLNFFTGDNSGAGDSGDITLTTGTSASANRGDIIMSALTLNLDNVGTTTMSQSGSSAALFLNAASQDAHIRILSNAVNYAIGADNGIFRINTGSGMSPSSVPSLSLNATFDMEMLASDDTAMAAFISQDATATMGGITVDYALDSDVTGLEFMTFQDADGTIGSIAADSAASVAFNTTSDQRLKTNIQDLTGALDKVDLLQVRTFDWIEDGKNDVGFIAQELDDVWPLVVSGDPEGDVAEKPMQVAYGKMTPLLAAAIKELHQKVKDLEARVEALEAQ